jgi:hypothetical protein
MRRPLPLIALALLMAAAPARADLDGAVRAVKAQPKIIDAVADNAGNLWVTALPDQTIAWSAYAGILCKVVVPHHARIFLIKMVDATSVGASKKPTDWRLIGAANCAAQ